MNLEEKIKQLAEAGMRLHLTQDNVDALTRLTDAQVKQLVAIVKSMAKGGGSLVLTDFPSLQPPTMRS